jgi:NADH-quinone oxidoreductase subunit J
LDHEIVMMPSLFSQAEPSAVGFNDFLRENWRLLVPLALGFIGVYLLLPRTRGKVPILAGAIAALGLVLAALWWTRYEGVWVEQLLFYIFSGLAVLGAGLMLSQHNPVHAALAFALVVLSSCGLFLLLAAPFLMAATIIIYAGAIVVTFLFVIMLAQQAGISSADTRSREPFLATLAGFVMLGTLAVILQRGYTTADMDGVLAKLEELTKAETKSDVNAVLGEPSKDNITLKFVDDIRKTFPALKPSAANDKDSPTALAAGAPDQLELAWVGQDVAAVKKSASIVLEHGQASRAMKGSLRAEKGASAAEPRKPLPAQNVAALGKTLFTGFLIPVEMAGVLLLVATIGAIVIASRGKEGLR